MREDRITASAPAPPALREMIWLVGQPPLADYLDFVAKKVIGGASPRALTDEWRAANDVYHALSEKEAGLCEQVQCRPLPKRLAGHEAAVRAHPWFKRSFAELPTSFAMVELDKLIVSQTYVERGHYDGVASALGRDLAARFDFCIPLRSELPPIRMERMDDHRWRFSSASADLRERAPVLIGQDRLGDLADGPVAAMLGLPIGFGANFMSAVRSGKRVALQNGYHRAYALRRAGITHAPCIIEEVTRKDELRVGGDDELNADPEFYFAAPRPPLLKDFFDARFAKLLHVREMETVIEVEIKVRSGSAVRWS